MITSPHRYRYAWQNTTGALPNKIGSDTLQPGSPAAYVGSEVVFSWLLTLPVTASGDYMDFSGSYPSKSFTHSGTKYLNLMTWRAPQEDSPTGQNNLLFTELTVYFGSDITNGGFPTTDEDTITLHTFDNSLAHKDSAHFSEAVIISGSSTWGVIIPPTAAALKTCRLNGGGGVNDRCALALQIQNTGVSSTTSGVILLVAKAVELLWTPRTWVCC